MYAMQASFKVASSHSMRSSTTMLHDWWIGVSETVRELGGASFHLSKETFDSVSISTFFVTKYDR